MDMVALADVGTAVATVMEAVDTAALVEALL